MQVERIDLNSAAFKQNPLNRSARLPGNEARVGGSWDGARATLHEVSQASRGRTAGKTSVGRANWRTDGHSTSGRPRLTRGAAQIHVVFRAGAAQFTGLRSVDLSTAAEDNLSPRAADATASELV